MIKPSAGCKQRYMYTYKHTNTVNENVQQNAKCRKKHTVRQINRLSNDTKTYNLKPGQYQVWKKKTKQTAAKDREEAA